MTASEKHSASAPHPFALFAKDHARIRQRATLIRSLPRPPHLTPNCQNKNSYISVNSSICFVTGFPAPCPAFDSIRNKIGRVRLPPLAAEACIKAAIFFACIGSTLVSVSAVINKTAGYSTPAFT